MLLCSPACTSSWSPAPPINGRASSGLLTAHAVPCACWCRLCGCIAEVEADARELLLPHGELAPATALREHYLLRTDEAEALAQVGQQVAAGLSWATAQRIAVG